MQVTMVGTQCTKSGCESKSPRVFIEGQPFCKNHGVFGLTECSAVCLISGNKCRARARTFTNGKYRCLRHGSAGTCSVCLEDMSGMAGCETTLCGHLFHTECLQKWQLSGGYTCPVCRYENHDLTMVLMVLRCMEEQTAQ